MLQKLPLLVPLQLHLLVSMAALATVSWALLTPDPYAAVSGTALQSLSSVDDLILHAAVFLVLSGCCLSLAGRIPGYDTSALAAWMVYYALATELLQAVVPGRTCDPLDALADIAGVVLGFRFARFIQAVVAPSPDWNRCRSTV